MTDDTGTLRRVAIAGASGAGKTTLAARIAALLGVPHVEIDALHWHAEWTPNPAFLTDVQAFVDGEAWVTEFQYERALPLIAARAELIVLLQPRRAVVLRRVLARTLRRRLGRQLLWGVNLEPPLWTILTDRDHIVRWSMRTLRLADARVRATVRERPGLRVVVVRSDRDAGVLLRRIASGTLASRAAAG